MKDFININQKAAVDLGLNLDIIDLAILDFIRSFVESEKCKKMTLNRVDYFSIKWNLIADNLPLIKIKTRQGIFNRLSNLIDAEIIIPHDYNQQWGESWYRFGKNKELLD